MHLFLKSCLKNPQIFQIKITLILFLYLSMYLPLSAILILLMAYSCVRHPVVPDIREMENTPSPNS